MNEVLVTDPQFEAAVQMLAMASDVQLADEKRRLQATEARGYYVELPRRRLSLKLAVRAAYDAAGVRWNGPQSRAVFNRFKHLNTGFKLVHDPKSRRLTQAELNEEEDLEREYVRRLKRKGQATFRRMLLELDPVCQLTGCLAAGALEAAHILPASENGKSTIENGMLLRADLHRLFDLGFLAIDPVHGRVWLNSTCRRDYADLQTFKLSRDRRRAWQQALRARWAARKR